MLSRLAWKGAAMSSMIRPLLIGLCLLVGCRDAVTGEARESQPAATVLQGNLPPLSPSLAIFFHVESGAEDRTQIVTPDFSFWRDRSVFANLAFNELDPATGALLTGAAWHPRFSMRSDIRRLHSPDDVLQNLLKLKDEMLDPERRGEGVSHIYLLPKRSEFESLREALLQHDIERLSPWTDISENCAYVRFANEAGDKQFSALFMYEPDRSVDLIEPSDRMCLTEMFARNLSLAQDDAQDLVFGSGDSAGAERETSEVNAPIMTTQGPIVDEAGVPLGAPRASGKCELARIIAPSQTIDWTVDVTDACPTPPGRRAAMLFAYVQAVGVGVPADAIPAIQRQIREVCGAERTNGELQDTEFKC